MKKCEDHKMAEEQNDLNKLKDAIDKKQKIEKNDKKRSDFLSKKITEKQAIDMERFEKVMHNQKEIEDQNKNKFKHLKNRDRVRQDLIAEIKDAI